MNFRVGMVLKDTCRLKGIQGPGAAAFGFPEPPDNMQLVRK